MKYVLQFQLMAPGEDRPDDTTQTERIESDNREFLPIPNVGDSVTCTLEASGRKAYKVKSRHFSYSEVTCIINLVVEDISPEEMAKRLKE